jgi:hypothetical protein
LVTVLTAFATSHLMADQQAQSDAKALAAMMDSQAMALLPPPVVR